MGVALNPLYSIAYGVRGRLGGNNKNLMEVRTMNAMTVPKLAPTMTSREIAVLTEKEHRHVMRDIETMLVSLEIDPEGYAQSWAHPQNGQTYREYALSEELTLTLVAGYNPKLRLRIIQRWKELESGSTSEPSFTIPQSFADALRLAAYQQETIQKQAEQLAIAAPAVEFVGKYVESTSGAKGFREVCKLLKAKEPEFRDFLQDSKIMYRLGGAWTAYQNHIDAGRFEVKTGTANDHAYSQAKFTPKGIEWVAGEWAKHQLRSTAV